MIEIIKIIFLGVGVLWLVSGLCHAIHFMWIMRDEITDVTLTLALMLIISGPIGLWYVNSDKMREAGDS